MSSNDLTERIAEELYYDQHPEGRHRSEWPTAVYPDDIYEYRDLAAAVLPIIAAEVRAAKAEALREEARYFAGGLHCADMRTTPEETVRHLNRRATEYKTGERA